MNMPIGRQVFINSGAMFTDLGGITLEERVLTGPHATIISVNHPLDPAERRGATILPGVSVGGKHRCGGRHGGARRRAVRYRCRRHPGQDPENTLRWRIWKR